jgi:hypothetical protein
MQASTFIDAPGQDAARLEMETRGADQLRRRRT